MKRKEVLNLMREDASGKIPDVFDSVVSSAQKSGLLNAGQAASLGAAHSAAAGAIAGTTASAAAADGTKIIISSLIASLAVTAAVGGTVGASLAVNGSNQANGGNTPPGIENPNPPVNPPEDPNPPVLVVETQGLEYKEIEGGYAVVGKGTAQGEEIVIPKTHEGKPVKEIADKAFYGLLIRTVTIQDNIEKIGVRAFSGYWLDTVSVDVNNARYCAKNNCIIDKTEKTLVMAAKDGIIPTDGSVTAIGDYAFENHTADVKLPEGILKIGNYAFSDSKLGEINGLQLPNGLKEIGEGAFASCEFIDELVLPSSVETIGMDAFDSCSSLQKAVINRGLKRINQAAFARCVNLKTVNLPVSLEYIGGFVFLDCESLESVNYEASECAWRNVRTDSAWNWWKGDNNDNAILLGDKFKCLPLGKADVVGIYRHEVYPEGPVTQVIHNSIQFEYDGWVIMQKTKGGDGYAYIGTWTCELYGDKLLIEINYEKFAVTGDIFADEAEGTGSVKFDFWYEVIPNTIGDKVQRCIRYCEGNDEFCNNSIIFTDQL